MNDVISLRGGAGRGQGRKPLSDEGAKSYKLLLTDAQRAKLDQLGNAAWIREQIDTESRLDSIDMANAKNRSSRYINALRQLPQYVCNTDNHGPLTHVMTGVRIVPTGDLLDASDDAGILKVVYPGGHSIEVIGKYLLDIAVKEAAEIEVTTAPDEFGIKESKYSHVQERTQNLLEHLSRKHDLHG